MARAANTKLDEQQSAIESPKLELHIAEAPATSVATAPDLSMNQIEIDQPTHREDPLLTISDVADQIGRHRNTVSQWIKDGLLASVVDPTGLARIRKSVVNKLLEGSSISTRI